MWVCLNGEFLPEDQAKVSVFDYGFLYGDGLFETLRCYRGQIFALEAHLNRLSCAASALRLPIPSESRLRGLLNDTLLKNNLQEALLRLSLSRGIGAPGLRPARCTSPTLVIAARSFEGCSEAQYKQGVSAVIVRTPRSAAVEGGANLKSLSFLNNVMARLEAEAQEAFEGIFTTKAGFLSEGSISNLFWCSRGKLSTPSRAAGILEGVTRQVIIGLARDAGWPVEEGLFRPKALFEAEEAFLSSTGLELMPLSTLNGQKIGTGRPGPVTQKLQALFSKAVLERTKPGGP